VSARAGVLVTANGLTKAFGSRPLFEGISCTVDAGDRIGLIGPNGAGKSTLLSILAGEVPADEGTVSLQRGLKLGFLSQMPQFREEATVRDTVLEGAAVHGAGEEDWKAALAADEVMAKLSLTSGGRSPDMLVSQLSGGWKKQVALARELVREPDLLLLDEPTNHLDVEAILWLETLLARSPFATITVTHDRVFLQRVANRILELDRRNEKGLLDVRGDYATYLTVKADRLAADEKRESSLRNRLRRETEWLMRGAKARSTKQQARIQRAAALEGEVGELSLRNQARTVRLDLEASDRNPKRLIEAKGIGKAYGENVLFSNLDLLVTPKSRIGLLGSNGCGKSTLLRILLGEESPDTGTVFRAENLAPITFEQGRESLDPLATVAQTLSPEGDHVEFRGALVHIRSYLDRFLFREEQKDMAVGKLSGGEQSRLLLARLMLKKTNLLVLDEPTNDLDLATLAVLEDCLADFPGAVLLVTHDRYFLDRVTNRILAFGRDAEGRGTLTALAGLEQWEAWREERRADGSARRAEAARVDAVTAARTRRLGYKEQRELDGLEELIQAAEAARDALRAESERPENVSDAAKLVDLHRAIGDRQAEVDCLYARWNALEVRRLAG
jgi:ABC transport system ATP-binding/permease protein